MSIDIKTYGDLRKLAKTIANKQTKEKVISKGKEIAIDQLLGFFPGASNIKSVVDLAKSAVKKPDTKKTDTWLDNFDIDDDVSAIVDDTIENAYIQDLAANIDKKPDDEPLPSDFTATKDLEKYIANKHNKKTVTNIQESKRIMRRLLEEPEEAPKTFEEDPMEFILRKYVSLNAILTELMTSSYREYIQAIFIVAPKPTTFKVILINGQHIFLTYMGPAYEATVAGKNYYLLNLGEKERCMLSISKLLRGGSPINNKGPEGAEQSADSASGEEGEGSSLSASGGGEEEGGEETGGGEETSLTEIRILEAIIKKMLIKEGVGQKGFDSEMKIYNLLKKHNKLPEGQGAPAGSSAWDVDLSFLDKNNKKHNLEVKYGLPDFGQLEIKWSEKDKFHFKKDYDQTDEKELEKYKIVQQLIAGGVEDQINLKWEAIPNRYSKTDHTMKDRAEDYKNFPSIYINVDQDTIKNYYKGKNVNYINIEPYGLYFFDEDNANTGAIKFSPGEVIIRIRLKSRKSSDPKGYGFLGALKIKTLPKSAIDLTKEADLVKALV